MDENVCEHCGEMIVVVSARNGTWTHQMIGLGRGMKWYIRACQNNANGVQTTVATPRAVREEPRYTLEEARAKLALEECMNGHTDIVELRKGDEDVAGELVCMGCMTRYVVKVEDD